MSFLTVYRSSAGSGKTFTLVKAYLRLVLTNPRVYRHTLAVTFTNKATAEMKERILQNLRELADGEDSAMRRALLSEIPHELNQQNLTERASQVLTYLLHDYSRFSVSTIDSFFNKVVRAFARELGLPANFALETDQQGVLSEVTDQLMLQYGQDQALRNWLQGFAFQKMADDKSWNIKHDLQELGQELFSEQYQRIQDTFRKHGEDVKPRLGSFMEWLYQYERDFERKLNDRLQAALDLVYAHGLTAADFKGGKRSSLIRTIEKLTTKLNNDELVKLRDNKLQSLENYDDLITKSCSAKVKEAVFTCADAGLWDALSELHRCLDESLPYYLTARNVRENIYPFSVLADLNQTLQNYRQEHEMLLVPDLNNLLKAVTDGVEAPFIFEKVGSTYQHFLLDEFQDTSDFQWDNLKPLLINALSTGYESLIVGDVKQSIYRWRGGNPEMLVRKLYQDLGGIREQVQEASLQVNRRSHEAVVRFNNALFSALPNLMAEQHGEQGNFLREAYAEVEQEWLEEKANGGYIRMSFLPGTKNPHEEAVQSHLMETIRDLEQRGYQYGEIAILVRENKHARLFAELLSGAEPSIPVISSNSLVVGQSPKVQVLVHAMQFLHNPTDTLVRAYLLNDYHQYIIAKDGYGAHERFQMAMDHEGTRAALPEELTRQQRYLQKLPLYDLGEALIRIFGLDKQYDAYLQRFLDMLLDYAKQQQGDLEKFLEWWAEEGYKAAVQTPTGEDAVRIETIHKTKGLEFPVVLLPNIRMEGKGGNKTHWMWEKPQHKDFSSVFPFLPVKYHKELAYTYFSESYEQETMLQSLDQLNMLYVACTRATEALYLWSPHPLTTNQTLSNGMHSTIYRALQSLGCEALANNRDQEEVATWGAPFSNRQSNLRKEENGVKSKPPFTSWRGKLNIRPRGSDVLKLYEGEVVDRINQGVLMHGILARIAYPRDVRQAVEQVYQEGLVTAEEQEPLIKAVEELLALPTVKPWFTATDWKIRNEQELLLPDGKTYRPDRVMTKEHQARVLDYKTGQRNAANEQQVKQYKNVLEQVGYDDVAAYLFYLEEKVIENIA